MADMLSQGWHIPFTPYRVIRARDFEQMIERLRINVPSSIRDSERTLAERDRILAEASAEAERIIQQARQQAMEMVSERALLATARQEAERIIEESRALARRRTEEADRYAVQKLEELAERLQLLLREVNNGIQILQAPEDEEADEASPGPSKGA
ncbi:hypothetical protein RY27_26385 [Litorilinea aerophila]|nr:hypothetical protein RY27_26385 [Litorilinea aerophila]